MKLSATWSARGFLSALHAALLGCPGQRIAGPARRAGRKHCVIMGLCASG